MKIYIFDDETIAPEDHARFVRRSLSRAILSNRPCTIRHLSERRLADEQTFTHRNQLKVTL